MNEFDDEIRRLLSEYQRYKLEIEMQRKANRTKSLREKEDRERREVERMDEKRQKAEEIFAITRAFLQQDTFFDLLDFYKVNNVNSRLEPSIIGFRERMERFGRVYSGNDNFLVIWSKVGETRSKMLAVVADGSLLYNISFNDRRGWRYRRSNTSFRRRFGNPADMAWGLTLARLNEIHLSLTLASINDLVTWQVTDEVHAVKGQLAKGVMEPDGLDADSDDDQDSLLYDVGDDDTDDESDD